MSTVVISDHRVGMTSIESILTQLFKGLVENII